MPADPEELPEGTSLLDRYTIIDRIGSGGMATIYRAHDSRLDRIVCVKVLRHLVEGSDSAHGNVIYQATYTHFLQEARALSKLAHPHTLRIYDFGFIEAEPPTPLPPPIADAMHIPVSVAYGPRPFQISEFLDAGNLETYVRTGGAMKPTEVLAILDRVAGAVGEAHEAGIIHRDIKPSNILFSRVGDALMPKLADFGIARALKRAPRLGESGGEFPWVPYIPLFSPRWAAPEQLQSTEEGTFTDVYAMGLVVAFMLAGRGLFDIPDITGTFAERTLGDAFVGRRVSDYAYPPEVSRVLMSALRADPRARTQSPFEFYAALAEAFGRPRASLPSPVAHSGVVRSLPPRRSEPSISVGVAFDDGAEHAVAPPERWLDVDGRRVRVVETHEKLELAVPRKRGGEVRCRITLLAGRDAQFGVNIKGLNCFVLKPEGRPSPAIVAEVDGQAEFMSRRRKGIGRDSVVVRERSGSCASVLRCTRRVGGTLPSGDVFPGVGARDWS